MANLLIGRPFHWTAGQSTFWPANPPIGRPIHNFQGQSMDWPANIVASRKCGLAQNLDWPDNQWLAGQSIDWPYFCFLLLTHSIVDGQSVDWPANPPNCRPIHQLASQSIIFKANRWIGQQILLHPELWIGPKFGLARQSMIGQPINWLALFLLPTSEP